MVWGILQFLSAAFQPNWTLLDVSTSNGWLLIWYHVQLLFSINCCLFAWLGLFNLLHPKFSCPLISMKQLGWGQFSAASHLDCCNPVDFTHGAILLCCCSENSDSAGLSCQTWDRHLIKKSTADLFFTVLPQATSLQFHRVKRYLRH